ncbi:MAG: hypothetical protein HGA76_12150, partial [Candidatus Firestonebacteria bacterium]|nr:hypothetical protein [Candidatus Firestonebacteria bacterium]
QVNDRAWWAQLSANYQKVPRLFEETVQKDVLADPKLNPKQLDSVEALRNEFKIFVDENFAKFSAGEKEAWKHFSGYFPDVGTKKDPAQNPAIGLGGIANASAAWWQDVHRVMLEAYNARSDLSDADRATWKHVVDLSGYISTRVTERTKLVLNGEVPAVTEALGSENLWTYEFFQWLDSHAFEGVWNLKDWVFHKGWGDTTFKEINELMDAVKAGKITAETHPVLKTWIEKGWLSDTARVDSANYVQSQIMQEMADFNHQNTTLFSFNPYNEPMIHAWLPMEEKTDGKSGQNFEFFFQGLSYHNQVIFRVFRIIEKILKNSKSAPDKMAKVYKDLLYMYADKTVKVKPNHIADYLKNQSLYKLLPKLGVGIITSLFGHNPLGAMGTAMVRQGKYKIHNIDSSMGAKYGDTGLAMISGPSGVVKMGFPVADKNKRNISDIEFFPKLIIGETIIEAEGVSAEDYLDETKGALSEVLQTLTAKKTAESIKVLSQVEETVRGEAQKQFIQKRIKFELAKAEQRLVGYMFEVEGKTFVQVGNRAVEINRTGLKNIPVELFAENELLLGNPALRRFLNVEEVTVEAVLKVLPYGQRSVTELPGIFKNQYSVEDVA